MRVCSCRADPSSCFWREIKSKVTRVGIMWVVMWRHASNMERSDLLPAIDQLTEKILRIKRSQSGFAHAERAELQPPTWGSTASYRPPPALVYILDLRTLISVFSIPLGIPEDLVLQSHLHFLRKILWKSLWQWCQISAKYSTHRISSVQHFSK